MIAAKDRMDGMNKKHYCFHSWYMQIENSLCYESLTWLVSMKKRFSRDWME